MSTRWPLPRMIEAVDRSPDRVAAHDRAGWLALFAPGAVVEDPVGSTPHRHAPDAVHGGPLGRFYDAFIAPNRIRFTVHADLGLGDEVAREVTIRTTTPGGYVIDVPAYLRYQLADDDGRLRIRRLAAHWDVRRMSLAAAAAGPAAWRGLGGQTVGLLRHLGPAGLAGYTRALLRGLFGRAPALVTALEEAVESADPRRLAERFVGPGAPVHLPDGRTVPAATLARELGPAARLHAEAVIPAGWTAAFRFVVRDPRGDRSRGLAFLEVDPPTGRIAAARLFGRPA